MKKVRLGRGIPLIRSVFGFLLLLSVMLHSNCSSMCNKEKKYDWRAGFSAAANFPSELYIGDLYSKTHGVMLRGGAMSGSPSSTWGGGSTSMGDNDVPLPTKLYLIWLCLIEDQFYEARIDLDTAKIRAIFEKGYPRNYGGDIRIDHRFEFLVNVAPGGTVAVWLEEGRGLNKTEVGFYPRVAKKIDIPWKEFAPLGNPRELYVPNIIADCIDSALLASYRKDGIPYDRWSNYRKKYEYNLLFREGDRPLYIYWYMVNGEKKTLEDKFIEVFYRGEYHELALPRKIHFVWYEPDPNKNLYTVKVEIPESEHEKMRSFFDRHEGKASFYIEPYIPRYVRQIKLFMISEEEKLEIELKEHEVYKF